MEECVARQQEACLPAAPHAVLLAGNFVLVLADEAQRLLLRDTRRQGHPQPVGLDVHHNAPGAGTPHETDGAQLRIGQSVHAGCR